MKQPHVPLGVRCQWLAVSSSQSFGLMPAALSALLRVVWLLMSWQLLPTQDCSFISRWFIVCRRVGSTFFRMFSSWWGSEVRLYTSTNDWRNNGKQSQTQSASLGTTAVQLQYTSPLFNTLDSPHCLQTRSIGGCVQQRSWRRRRCYCRHPHTHSLGNIAEVWWQRNTALSCMSHWPQLQSQFRVQS